MPVTFYDPKTGAPTQLAPEEAQKAFLAGQAGPGKGQQVHVRLSDGRVGTTPAEDLHKVLGAGAQIIDPEAEKHAKDVEKESGLAGGIEAGVLGAVNGAAGFMGTGAIRQGIQAFSPAMAEKFQHKAENLKEAHPWVDAITGLGGAIAATAVAPEAVEAEAPGIAAGLAKLAPSGIISRLGGAAAEGVESLAAKAGIENLVAKKLVGAAVRGGVENTVINVTSQIGEDALGDKNVAADKLFTANGLVGLGKSFGTGAAIGTAFGAAGMGVSKAWNKYAGKGTKALLSEAAEVADTKAAAAADNAATKAPGGGIEDLTPSGSKAGFAHSAPEVSAASPEGQEVSPATEPVAADLSEADQLRAAKKGIPKNPHDLAADQMWRATGAREVLSKEANARAGGTRAVGATMLREVIGDASIKDAASFTPEVLLDKTQTAMRRIGKEIGETVEGNRATVTVGEILGEIEKVHKPLRENAFASTADSKIAADRDRLMEVLGLVDATGKPLVGDALAPRLKDPIPFEKLVAQRRNLQDVAFVEAKALDPHQRVVALRDISAGWNELERKALENAEVGSGDKFRALNKTYQQLHIGEKALQTTVAKGASNLSVGLVDRMTGHSGMAVGGAIGAAFAGPLGAAGGATVGDVTGSYLSKLARERGNVLSAVALTKMGNLGTVKAIMSHVDSAVGNAAEGVLSLKQLKMRSVTGALRLPQDKKDKDETVHTKYREAIKHLDDIQQQDIAGHAHNATRDLATHAPGVAAAYTTNLARSVDYLESKRPKPLAPASMYAPTEPSVLATDKSSFLRTYKAVSDPMSVLADMHRGKVTREAADALKATAPEVYKELQNKIIEGLAKSHEAGHPLPFRKRMELGMLFDVPTDLSLLPANFNMLQSNVSQPSDPKQPAAKGGKSNSPRHGKVDINNPANSLDILADKGVGYRRK